MNDKLNKYFDSRYGEDNTLPGAAIIIAKDNSIVYESYRGIADIASGKPIDSSTTFCIASVSKQFTVVSLLQLAEKGRVSLNSSLSNYFPDYKSDIWQKITPAHLASHTSGIPDLRDRSTPEAAIFADDSTSMVYFNTLNHLLFEPGEAYDYQNPTFLLLAKIIEQKSGMNFAAYQQQHIFNPAGMNSTYYFDPHNTPQNQANAYRLDKNGLWEEFGYGKETFFATRPDGGIYSTARDIVKWEHALKHNSLISQSSLMLAYTPFIEVSTSPYCSYQRRPHTFYGLGWFIENRPGKPRKIFHTGDNGGFQAYVGKYPDYNVEVIILENRNDLSRWKMVEDIEYILANEGLLG